MKILKAGSAILFLILGTASVNATTCQDLVQNCVVKGGTKQACNKNLRQCLKTCTMVGPYSGRSFQADEGCGSRRKK